MAYEAWERDHDTKLVAKLKAARFVEEAKGAGVLIHLAHLTGEVNFGDGVMFWKIYGNADVGGRKPVDQQDIDGSAAYLLNYGRKAVRNELGKWADATIASATKRLEQAR